MVFIGMGIDTWEEKKLKIKLSIMDRSTAPFEVGDEVVCIDRTPSNVNSSIRAHNYLKRFKMYKVSSVQWVCCYWVITVGILKPIQSNISICNCGKEVKLDGREWAFRASRFRKVNPYQSSVSRSLAEIAVESIGDGQDMKPLKVREVLQ